MNPRMRAEFIQEVHARQGEEERQRRFCQYGVDIILDSMDEREPGSQLDPAFNEMSPEEREDYLTEQGKRLGADLLLFAQGWGVARLELVDEWRARRDGA